MAIFKSEDGYYQVRVGGKVIATKLNKDSAKLAEAEAREAHEASVAEQFDTPVYASKKGKAATAVVDPTFDDGMEDNDESFDAETEELSQLTKVQLQERLDAFEAKYSQRLRKAELINLLQGFTNR